MTTVKMMRSSTATPAPSTMPHNRCRGGRPTHAIAMTTALSPDSRTLIHMILRSATQNVGWPTSLQPLVTMASHVPGSVMCPSIPKPLPLSRMGVQARPCHCRHGQSTGQTGVMTSARLAENVARCSYPTISFPEKNWAISLAAVSGASDPWTEFSPIDFACDLRIVPGAALAGSVAPMMSR